MKKIILFIFLLTFGFNMRVNSVEAIWSNVASDIGIRVSEEMMIEIRIVINATAKMAAIKQVQNTIQSSLTGASDSPKYIKNYRDFLLIDPRDKAKVSTNDFLTMTLRGQTSGNYISDNTIASTEGVNISYQDFMFNIGQATIEGNGQTEVNITEICEPLNGLFAQGDWDCFSEMMNNQINLPVGLSIATQSYLDQKTSEYQLEAQAMAQASKGGFLPIIDVDGNVTLPAGSVAELLNQSITLPIEAIANSDSEAFSTLIESFAASAISEVVQYGLGESERSFRDTSDKFSSSFNNSYSDSSNKFGPETNFNANILWQ